MSLYENTLALGSTEQVIIYKYENNDWQQKALITADDNESGDGFGNALNLYNNYLIVGAVSDDYGTSDNSGSAYIFEFDGQQWQQKIKLKAQLDNNTIFSEVFGYSVAINKNIAIVGGSQEIINNAFNTHIYIFERINNQWLQTDKITPDITEDKFLFGRILSLKNNRIITSNCCHNFNPQSNNNYKSHLFIFDRINNQWHNTARLTTADAEFDHYGISFANENDTLVVGAPDFNHFSQEHFSGGVYVYKYNNGLWQQKQYIVPPTNSHYTKFGFKVATHINKILIGARAYESEVNNMSALTYKYSKNSQDWLIHQALNDSSNYNQSTLVELNHLWKIIYRDDLQTLLIYHADDIFNNGFD